MFALKGMALLRLVEFHGLPISDKFWVLKLIVVPCYNAIKFIQILGRKVGGHIDQASQIRRIGLSLNPAFMASRYNGLV